MPTNESEYLKRANTLLAGRFYWLAGIVVAFAATLCWGVAPAGFLACSLGLGLVAFCCLLLVWRFHFFLFDLAWTLLFVFVPRELGQRYGVPYGATFWQGFLLSLLLVLSLLCIFTSAIRRICRLPTPVA